MKMTMLLYAAPYPLREEDRERLVRLDCVVLESTPQTGPVAGMEQAEVFVGMGHFLAARLDDMPALKMVQLCSAGYDQVPLEKLRARGITLCNARGVMSIPVAEWVLLKVLEIYKDTRYFLAVQKERRWQMKTDLQELYGKTMGIIGTGSIGTEVAKRAQAFGCRVIGLNTRGDKRPYFDSCLPRTKLAELLAQSDIVVLALPYSPSSHHLLHRETLRYMKDDAVLVNIARGGVINEDDLLAHLESGKLRGAALDVFSREPLPAESPLWQHERVLVTPHNSFASGQVQERLRELVLANLEAYIKGLPLRNLVL
ncbi:MAG: dihydrofolate reductase [Firmicutes bacterium]|nr:dihydrofolate reductase [Bacillota bacterium]